MGGGDLTSPPVPPGQEPPNVFGFLFSQRGPGAPGTPHGDTGDLPIRLFGFLGNASDGRNASKIAKKIFKNFQKITKKTNKKPSSSETIGSTNPRDPWHPS